MIDCKAGNQLPVLISNTLVDKLCLMVFQEASSFDRFHSDSSLKVTGWTTEDEAKVPLQNVATLSKIITHRVYKRRWQASFNLTLTVFVDLGPVGRSNKRSERAIRRII